MQGKPTLKELPVFGVIAGQTTKLTLTGENLAPTGVKVNGPVQAKLIESKPTQVIVEVTPAPDCPAESFDLTLEHPKDSPAVKLPVLVSAPDIVVKKPLSRFDQAMPLSPPAAVQTTLDNDQPHLYRVELKRGETLALTLTAARSPQSDMDAVVRIRDERRLARTMATGPIKRDRRLRFTAPQDGPFFIEISDSQQRGGGRMLYRLTLIRF